MIISVEVVTGIIKKINAAKRNMVNVKGEKIENESNESKHRINYKINASSIRIRKEIKK